MLDRTKSVISEERIRLAVELGSAQYWEDSRKQAEAHRKWREHRFEGPCEQFVRGSVTDYIVREIMKLLAR